MGLIIHGDKPTVWQYLGNFLLGLFEFTIGFFLVVADLLYQGACWIVEIFGKLYNRVRKIKKLPQKIALVLVAGSLCVIIITIGWGITEKAVHSWNCYKYVSCLKECSPNKAIVVKTMIAVLIPAVAFLITGGIYREFFDS